MPELADRQRADAVLRLIVDAVSEGMEPPDCGSLGEWLDQEECPREVLDQVEQLMLELMGDGVRRSLVTVNAEGLVVWGRDWGRYEAIAVHRLADSWAEVDPERRPVFPLTPLVRGWLYRLRSVVLDRRTTGIMPFPTQITGHGQLEFNLNVAGSGPGLGFSPLSDEISPVRLPGLAPMDETLIVPPTLLLYDSSVMPAEKGGHGAPLSMRIWVESVMAMGKDDRFAPGRLKIGTRELVGWLWPNGGFRPSRHFPQLMAGLEAVNKAVIRWKEGFWSAVLVRNYPYGPDDPVIFEVSLPPGSGRGPLVHRKVLREYGVRAAPLYRGYLAVAYIWDEYGTHGGKITQATRPAVVRDDEGNILDEGGRRVIGENGRPVRSWKHPKAVRLGWREPNPWAEKYPVIAESELVRLVNSVSRDLVSRMARVRAVRTFAAMAEDGVITLETGLKNSMGEQSVRIMPPERWGPRWSPPPGFGSRQGP